MQSADHNGITKGIDGSFQELNLDSPYDQKLIGFSSDGVSVNRGRNDSIKTNLREKSPWLLFVWCVAHRLELGLDDALFKSTEFEEVDEMLRHWCQWKIVHGNVEKDFRFTQE